MPGAAPAAETSTALSSSSFTAEEEHKRAAVMGAAGVVGALLLTLSWTPWNRSLKKERLPRL